jgi:putative tryptophan/tyrosine transport system substrate-binding protein
MPLAARAQQSKVPVVGFLHSGVPERFARQVAAFRQGLSEAGYTEPQNVAIEFRWAQGQFDRLPALAGELIERQVAVIMAAGGANPAVAAKAATATVPIVFSHGSDPISIGLVASLNRPGGNVTGISTLTSELDAKRLELLRLLLGDVPLIGVLMNPDRSDSGRQLQELQNAARSVQQRIHVETVNRDEELEPAFATLSQQRVGALMVGAGTFFNTRRDRVIALAARHAIPASYPLRESAAAGGLMSYGSSTTDSYHQAALYCGRILKGTRPADLPVMQSVQFELVINLKTAKNLGIAVPTTLLARAEEVIE